MDSVNAHVKNIKLEAKELKVRPKGEAHFKSEGEKRAISNPKKSLQILCFFL